MYRVDRNNYLKNNKNSRVLTPYYISNFIYRVLRFSIPQHKVIFDPCVGEGSLLIPWRENGYETFGIDIIPTIFPNTMVKNYINLKKKELPKNIGLVLINPPFNLDDNIKETITSKYGGKAFLPQVFLEKTIELVGKNVPIVLFSPYGLRLNLTETSKRWIKFLKEYPNISSIISLPKNAFSKVLFHSEIVIFNVSKIKPHYFLGERVH